MQVGIPMPALGAQSKTLAAFSEKWKARTFTSLAVSTLRCFVHPY